MGCLKLTYKKESYLPYKLPVLQIVHVKKVLTLKNSTEKIHSENLYRYGGKEIINDLGLNIYNFVNRSYAPAMGRFLQVDELASAPNQVRMSPYAAMWNSPLRYVDPDGRAPQDKIIEISKGNFKYVKDQHGTNLISTHYLNGDVVYIRKGHPTVKIESGHAERKMSEYRAGVAKRREFAKKTGKTINSLGDGIAALGYVAAPFTEGASLAVSAVGEGIALTGKAITNIANFEESGASTENVINFGVDVVAEIAPLPLENLVIKSNFDDVTKKIIRSEIGKVKQTSEFVIKKEIEENRSNGN